MIHPSVTRSHKLIMNSKLSDALAPDNKLMCKVCKTKGSLMGDDESLFECKTNIHHIWSYHFVCKKGGSKQGAEFVGWIPYEMYNEGFSKVYDGDMLEDGSTFLWYCKCCKTHYTNMYSG